jgi:hypothetical protein
VRHVVTCPLGSCQPHAAMADSGQIPTQEVANGLDLTGARIHEAQSSSEGTASPRARTPARAPHRALHAGPKAAPSIKLPNQDAQYVSHIAIDIGGSLIKLVYFSPDPSEPSQDAASSSTGVRANGRGGAWNGPPPHTCASPHMRASRGQAQAAAACHQREHARMLGSWV